MGGLYYFNCNDFDTFVIVLKTNSIFLVSFFHVEGSRALLK